eukprot:2656570-Ditylum_brightwellii.AAC.1
MESVRRGDHSQGGRKAVKGGTTREAMDNVCVILKESGVGNPSKSSAGKLKLSLGHQICGYLKQDPPTKHQKALPPSVYRDILRHDNTPLRRA